MLLQSLDTAHETILKQEGGLTTLCVALVAPLRDSKQFVVCIVNVGDSLGFVFSKHHGIREITTGTCAPGGDSLNQNVLFEIRKFDIH